MTENDSQKKYALVLVHADMWGAYNANMLVKAVKEHGAEPILIATRSTPGKDGKPLTKVSDLVPSRVLKEASMLRFFELIDNYNSLLGLVPDKSQLPEPPEYLTFNALASAYCVDGKAHFTTSGGPKGGIEILEIVEALKARGIIPEILLSGDTLAILPEALTANVDCFGTHPGPLPYIKGMQGTERSLVNHMFYDRDGNYMPPGSYLPGGGTHIKGCFFNLAPVLDEGPLIAEGLTPVMPGMDLLQARRDLYYALVEVMIEHLPQLLDKTARSELLNKARANRKPHHGDEIPDLTPDQLIKWHGDGFAVGSEDGSLDIIPNLIVDPFYFKRRMADFFPGARVTTATPEGETRSYSEFFELAFSIAFGKDILTIMEQAQESEGHQMRLMRELQARGERGEDLDTPSPAHLEFSRMVNNVNKGRPLDAPADPNDPLVPFIEYPSAGPRYR